MLVARRSIVLEEMGLLAGVEWLAERVEDRSDVRVEIVVEATADAAGGEAGRPPRDVERAAFRVAQLALDNVVRHAPGAHGAVSRSRRPRRRVRLRIEDDGDGPPVDEAAAARGGPARDRGHARRGEGVRGGARVGRGRGRARDGGRVPLAAEVPDASRRAAHRCSLATWLVIERRRHGRHRGAARGLEHRPDAVHAGRRLDPASLPGLVAFVRGDRRRRDDDPRRARRGRAGSATRSGRSSSTASWRRPAASIPVCVGVSHASTDRAIAFAREAEAAGAHSVMLAPPPLARPTDAALRRHYLAVAGAIDSRSSSRTTRQLRASR